MEEHNIIKTRIQRAYARIQAAVVRSEYTGNSTVGGVWTGPTPTLERAAELVGLVGRDLWSASSNNLEASTRVKTAAKALLRYTHPDKYVPTNAADAVMADAVYKSAVECLKIPISYSADRGSATSKKAPPLQ